MSKVYSRRHGCACRPAPRQHDDRCGRVRAVRHTGKSHRRIARQRREGPHHRRQQRRRGWLRHGRSAHHAAGEKVMASYVGENKEFERQVLSGRARTRAHPAGHTGRAVARGRRGHPGVLHSHRLRHQTDRGQGDESFRRQGIRARTRHHSRGLAREGVEGRQIRQPHFSKNLTELQPDDRQLRQGLRRRGRATRRDRRARSRPDPHAGHFRRSHHPGPELRKTDRVPHRAGQRSAKKKIRSAI